MIDPRPDTAWPVYVEPPLHVGSLGGAPLPAGLFDSITSTVSSVTDTVASAASTAMSATVSGAKAVGTFVKQNPLESAMLVGGVALALTGVGGPASAAMIASATVNLTSAGLDIAAAAMPDKQTLANVATGFDIASALTPQGAAKNAVKEGAELAAKQRRDLPASLREGARVQTIWGRTTGRQIDSSGSRPLPRRPKKGSPDQC